MDLKVNKFRISIGTKRWGKESHTKIHHTNTFQHKNCWPLVMAVRVVRLIKKQLKPNEKQDFWYLKWSLYKELNQILISAGSRHIAYWVRIWNSSTGILSLPGASVRHSAHDKGHEEGGSAYAKAGSSLRSSPGNSQASTPKTRVCLLCALCSHLHLWLYGGLSPTTSLWKKKELTYSSS